MFRDVPASSKLLEGFRKIIPSGFRPLTPEMQVVLDTADKLKKGGNGLKKEVKKDGSSEARKRKTPTPSASEDSDSETESNVRVETNQPIRNEEEILVCYEEAETVHNQEPPIHNEEDTMNREVTVNVSDMGATTSLFTTPVSSSISPIRNDDLEIIFVDAGQLKVINEKLDQLLLASKSSFYDAYSKAAVESLFERITNEHEENAKKMNASVFEFAEVCKSTTKKVNKLISEMTNFMETYRTNYKNNIASVNEALRNLGAMFKTEKLNLKKVCSKLQQDHASFQISLTSHITKLQDELAMESNIMDALARKTEKGVSPQSSEYKQGGEGASKVQPQKVLAKPIIKNEPKGKEKLIEEELIIDDDKDKEPDEAELKRRKVCGVELNETQRIVKEAEEKERAEREAQAILKSRMLLFPKWTLKKSQHDVVELPKVGSTDVDIPKVLKKKPTDVPREAPKDLEKLKPGRIYKEGWFVVYQYRE
ncbi:unnamed protein product [Lactuca saligna]|uniref:Uncharacterized protein n=1 Tax=Lactuca saligna TaxID=75948 RepID=A0AA35YWI1_LACSI|nr:unnamed protein product [Lactuca saligna]